MKRFQKMLACLLAFGMILSLLPVQAWAADETGENYIYFLNSAKWETIGAYVYGDKGELLGGWGSATAGAAPEAGENWVKVAVSELPPFSIVFYNTANESERAELYLPDAEHVYVTLQNGAFTSKEAAEEAVYGDEDPDADYIYFLNSSKWETVGAYVYGDKGELLGGWGSATAKAAPEIGGSWVKVAVSELPPFSIVFYNTANESERAELYLPDAEHIYVTITGQSFTSAEDAEQAVDAAPTTIYFLNWDGEKTVLDNVYVYAYANDQPVGAGWPGKRAEKASDLGENWWKVELEANASLTPFTVIFNNNSGEQLPDIAISSYSDNYVTARADKVYTNQTEAEKSVGIVYETVVYFLNDKDWPGVNAYVYGQPGQALGVWPGAATEASELGGKWRQITVPAQLPFNIIFFNTESDGERIETLLSNANQLYLASTGAYGSKLEAELDTGLADPSLGTTLHFYNYRNWGDINGYFYTEDKTAGSTTVIGAGWPGKATDEDAETGADWWKVFVPKNAEEEPFFAIFNDGVNQTDDIEIVGKTNVYITPGGQKFADAAAAEAAAAEEKVDDGCEEGPNADLDDYSASYPGAGAALPHVTYEAEAAATNAEVLPYATDYRETVQSEASGRQAVRLENTGDYVEFTLTRPANSLVLRYSMPDSADGAGINAPLSLYIDGTEKRNLDLTSKYAWVYGGYPYYNTPDSGLAHRFFDEARLLLDETLPAGTTIRLQKDADDTAAYYVIDFIECELVAAPLTQPAGSLSVTDFGAVPNDGQDDYDAFAAAIAAAEAQGRELWIPAGTFDLVEKTALAVKSVTIRGAGMWHTNLRGAGAAFKFSGTCKFYDFAMTGVSAIRDDAGDLAGFENGGRTTNVTIQNIWMEHMKVGVWTANTARMAIQGCRIRNTYADGINLCSGVTDSVVRNNSLRNTGDDCVAIWPWLANSTGNTISHNTIQVPTLANGIAIYGGGDNTADSNYIADIINNGAGIVVGSEFDTPKGFTAPVTVKDNVLDRCGSMQTDENYMIGAIWIWNSFHHAMNTTTFTVSGNQMKDCPQVGITIEHNMDELTGVNLQDNSINGAKHAIFSYLSGGGYGSIKRLTQENITGEPFVYAAHQGDAARAMASYEEDGKVFLKGDGSAFVLEIKEDDNPDFPGIPDVPNIPVSPGASNTPARPGSSSASEKPGSTGLPVSTETTNQGGLPLTETTAVPPAQNQGGVATAAVDADMGSEIVKQAVSNQSKNIVIAPDITGDVTKTVVSLPASTVNEIGSQTDARLTISTPVADVTIPNSGLGSLSSAGGNVTISVERVGSEVTLSVTAGGRAVKEIPGGLTVTVPIANTTPGTVAVLIHEDGTRETVRKSVASGGSITVPLDGSAKLEIVDNSRHFADVSATSWARDAVAFASAHELFNGTSETQFSPDLPVSRGMLAVVLFNLEGGPDNSAANMFADVRGGEWYAAGIIWAASENIISGYGDGRFGPNDSITREQLAVMLWRYAGSPSVSQGLNFADADQASSYALDALRWVVGNGIMNGKGGGILDPQGTASRAEAAQMLMNYLTK